ncbi:porin [Vibrio mediterranei]
MKKLSILAIAVMAASGANAAEIISQDGMTLSVGGRVEARADVMNSESKVANTETQDVSDQSRARLNIDAKKDLGDGLFVHGFFENQYTKAGLDETRHLYVGGGSDKYELRYGKTDGSLGQVTDIVDFFDTYSGQSQAKLKTADRAANQLLFVGDVANFTIKANANGGGSEYSSAADIDSSVTGKVDYGFGISAKGDVGAGFTVGAGYAYESIKDINTATRGNNLSADANEIIAGLGYTIDAFYISYGVNYTTVSLKDNDYTTLGHAVAGQYNVNDKLALRLGYALETIDNDIGADKDDNSFTSGEVSYTVNPNFTVYTGLEYGLSGKKEDAIRGRLGAKVVF